LGGRRAQVPGTRRRGDHERRRNPSGGFCQSEEPVYERPSGERISHVAEIVKFRGVGDIIIE
jgi:hypothetical protein